VFTATERTYQGYSRHEPEKTILYRTIQDHFQTFVARAESKTEKLPFPMHVFQEVEAYLGCGILAKGLVRLICESCKNERLVAFSCKKRGFCPSCGGRRMTEVAMHLVDRVFPPVPVRQWVLSFPFSVRYALAYNPTLVTKVLAIYIRVISNWYEKAARRNGISGKTAAVTFVQRFGGAINLNVHFHSLFLDGVFTKKNGKLHFVPVFPPTNEEIVTLAKRVNLRVSRHLEKKGLTMDDFSEDPFAHEQPVLAQIAGASVQSRIGIGEREGLLVRKVGNEISGRTAYFVSERCALSDGFSLHANVQIKGNDRKRLEKLCRYTARPPIALERLSEAPDGKILYRLKTKYSDGTTHILFAPLELVEKVVALIPPPRANLLRYHGLLAPNSKVRAKIVPEQAKDKKENTEYPAQAKWAELLKRSFAIEILKCDKCGGKMKLVSIIQDPAVAKRILEAIGLSAEVPLKAAPRAPPMNDLSDPNLTLDDYSQLTPNDDAF